MITTRDVEITIRVVVQINTDELDYGVSGGAEDEDAVEEAISYAVQELDYSMNITEPGILILKTEIRSYNV
jgi:hypothetical protein